MASCLLAWNNLVDDGCTFQTLGWAPNNATTEMLKSRNLRERWNSGSVGSTSTRLFWSLPASTAVALVGLMSHNLSLAATVQVRASNDSAFGSTLYDSGTINVWPGAVTAASRRGLRWNWWLKLPSAVTATYWRIQLNDGSNSDGYLYAGRLFLAGNVWQPSVNMLGGAELGFEDKSDALEALSGAEWFVEREALRYARFGLGQMAEAEMLANAFDLQRVGAASRREVLFAWDSADGEHAPRRTLFGRLRALSPLETPYGTEHRTALQVKESL